MSTIVPDLVSTTWQFDRDQHFCPEYPPHAGYAGIATLPLRSSNNMANQRSHGWSPISSTSSQSLAGSTSFDPSSKATSRSPPARVRTPIQRHPSSSSRMPSSMRPNTIVPSTTQQDRPVPTSHGVATPQGSFASPVCLMSSTNPSYSDQSYYYPSAEDSHPELDASCMSAPTFPYSLEPSESTYYPAASSTLYNVETLSSIPEPSEPLFQPVPSSNAVSRTWSSPIPSNHVPPVTYPASPPSLPGSTAYWTENPEGIRILASRPKPQCFEHGCKGRHFSTFSNLLRHQREKSGSASKHVCPHCGTEFTRTTARKGHMEGGKCKAMGGRGGSEPRS